MGFLGKMATLVIGSKVVETVSKTISKTSSTIAKNIEEQSAKKVNDKQQKRLNQYCVYIKNNFDRICNLLDDVQSETEEIIEYIKEREGDWTLSLKERSDFKQAKIDVITNLKYLYLSRDCLIALSKISSGIQLKKDDLVLVIRVLPYFDGIPILEINHKDSDYSIIGDFEEIESELEMLGSSKKELKQFDFKEYLARHDRNIKEYVMPEIDEVLDGLKNSFNINDNDKIQNNLASIEQPKEHVCNKCHTPLAPNTKFCPQCGNQIQTKSSFCSQCGTALASDAKFCANCGKQI